MKNYKFILLLNLALAAHPLPARLSAPAAAAADTALERLRQRRPELGLDCQDDFVLKDRVEDGLGFVHLRLQQTRQGLPVWGAQAILHLAPDGSEAPMTDALVRGIQVPASPNLEAPEALAAGLDRVAPRGPFASRPGAELVLWPEPAAARHHLAWHVHLEVENGAEDTRHQDLLVDAHTGAVLRSWSTLFTARGPRRSRPADGVPVRGEGISRYSGRVPLDFLRTAQGYQLRDPGRGGLATRNMAGATYGPGQDFASATPTWGDGQNYDRGRGPDSVNAQTAAVDAHYGLQVAWDFYWRVLDRDGIDGRGTGPVSRVHYAHDYDNAFWSDDCLCMTYGDGAGSRAYTALDVVGHEVSHGLCHATADLDYEGESGALNEANSDIFGAMIGFYARGAGGRGSRVPDQGGSWNIGTQVEGDAYRFMMQPSLDGLSPDAWSPYLKFLDVHFGSGPMNRAFYFLAQGASADPRSRAYSRWLPEGLRGIGNDKALRIWWRTLSTRLTPSSGYHEALAGAVQSALELYGAGSREQQAVRAAFRAVNVVPQ